MAQSPRPGSIKEAVQIQGKRPYGEESRRYRRTIYRHENWLQHRSETRLLRNLQGTLSSGVVRSLLSEVAAVVLVSLLVLLWNATLFGYVDILNAPHPGIYGAGVPAFLRIQLPITLFTLSSPALGLLLVFRTNTSYARSLEARQAWDRIISHCRNIMRQSTLWIDLDTDKQAALRALNEISLCVRSAHVGKGLPRSLWAHLSDPAKEPRFAAEVKQKMGSEAVATLLDAQHRPLRVLALVSGAMDRLPIDEKKKVEMDKSVILLGDTCETCERIFSSPVPLVYARHSTPL
jgi:ion channel-forming bestrophin family protein